MLFDVVQEVRAVVEAGVAAAPRVEGEVECLKRGLEELREDVNQRLCNLEGDASDSGLVSAVEGYANTLKEWTWRSTATVIYDSTVDEFTDECLFQAVKGRQDIAIVATTTDGDVFGGFYYMAVTRQDEWHYDVNMFIFSFESHGRCETPQMFDETRGDAGVEFFKNDASGRFVEFYGGCGGRFSLGNEKSTTMCNNLSRGFKNIEDTTLTGTNHPEKFTCTRLVAIQFE